MRHGVPQGRAGSPSRCEHLLLRRVRDRNRAEVPELNIYFNIFSGRLILLQLLAFMIDEREILEAFVKYLLT